jgi:hypothetical protein
MTDLSVSIFVIVTLFFVTLGSILAAVGYGYAHGYFKRRRSPRIICGICGNKTSRLRKYCAACGAPPLNFVELATEN